MPIILEYTVYINYKFFPSKKQFLQTEESDVRNVVDVLDVLDVRNMADVLDVLYIYMLDVHSQWM